MRPRLPRPTDRLPLGQTGLTVSPLCLGMTADPDVVCAAFDIGINFFFITADLHWPLYANIREGISRLLAREGVSRDDIVVAVVSYLESPLFDYLQLHEVVNVVDGLDHVDVIVAGAISSPESLRQRLSPIAQARARNQLRARAIGGTFHSRSTALASLNANCMDIHFVRYNPGHPGARTDIFPALRRDRTSLLYNFKSVLFPVTAERFAELGLGSSYWLPSPTDYYRFALSRGPIDGLLCSPMSTAEVEQLARALEQPPLTDEEDAHMLWLSAIGSPMLAPSSGLSDAND